MIHLSIVVLSAMAACALFGWALAQLLNFVGQWLDWRQIERAAKANRKQVRAALSYPTDEQIRRWDAVGDDLKQQRDSRRPPQDSEPTMPGAA